jgi:hypothetical protein
VRDPAQAEYLAWQLGTELARYQWRDSATAARRVAAAVALFYAWRDDLAQREAQRRLREVPDAFDEVSAGEVDCDE